MGRALSVDLREGALARLGKGGSVRAVAAGLDVAPSSVVKWSQRPRGTGSCAPAGTGKIADAPEIWMPDRIETPFSLRGLLAERAERRKLARVAADRSSSRIDRSLRGRVSQAWKPRRDTPSASHIRLTARDPPHLIGPI